MMFYGYTHITVLTRIQSSQNRLTMELSGFYNGFVRIFNENNDKCFQCKFGS